MPLARSLVATFFPLVGSYIAGAVATLVAFVFGGIGDALLCSGRWW